jgi:hypothetical protein
MDNLVWNERTKLLAGAIDRLSTACFTLGILTPVAAGIYGSEQLGLGPQFLLLAAGSWIIGGFALHMFAQIVLGKLQQ